MEKLKSIVLHPGFMLLIALVIVSGLLIFVAPKFERIFAEALPGVPLPGLTVVVFGLSDIFTHQWYLVLGAIIVIASGYKVFAATPTGSSVIGRLESQLSPIRWILEPVIIVMLAVIVGMIVIALFMPMVRMVNHMG